MSHFRRLSPLGLHEQPWANGAGGTTVLASGPHSEEWCWRLSIARIEQDAAFSSFPATRRQFVSLDAPIELHFPGGKMQSLLRLAVTEFDGMEAPDAKLLDGPTRAFNLMLRGNAQGTLIARPLNGRMLLPVQANARWFLHVISGSAQLSCDDETLPLGVHESVWIDNTSNSRALIEGGGELVLVQLANPITPDPSADCPTQTN